MTRKPGWPPRQHDPPGWPAWLPAKGARVDAGKTGEAGSTGYRHMPGDFPESPGLGTSREPGGHYGSSA